MNNPFRNRIVSTPWASGEIEVPEINSDAFHLCCQALDTVRREKRSISILLTGQTGSGKTHLLNRIQNHLRTTGRIHLFLAVRLHTSPHRFWRHLRKNCVESFEKPFQNNRSQLDLIFLRRLFLECHRRTVPTRMLPGLIEQIRFHSDISRQMMTAFQNLIHQTNVPDTLAWLKGYSLSDDSLQKIGLHSRQSDPDGLEDSAREFVKELFRMAGPDIPIVLCFDQVEALQRYPGDDAGLFTFGQAVRTLNNETQNLLIVSCVQTFFLMDLKKAVMVPDFDGMSEYHKHLDHLTVSQARLLIAARLNAAIDDDALKNDMFRTMEKGLKSFVSESNRTAREVLTFAASVFDRMQCPGNLPDPENESVQPKDRFLETELDIREAVARKHQVADHLDEIIQGSVPTLCHIWNAQCRESDGLSIPDIDMILACGEKKTHISLCNQSSLNSLAARLRRLQKRIQAGQGATNLILIRHAERRIPSSAKKVREYLQSLKFQGARWMTPSRETLSVLDALRNLLNDAKSGDLNHGGNPILESTVREWIRNAFDGPARLFVDTMMTPPQPDWETDSNTLSNLMELLKSERVIWLSDAAAKLNRDSGLLENLIRPDIHRIGWLAGPPSLLYDVSSL